MIYSGNVEIKCPDLIGKEAYKASVDLKVTGEGIRRGFAKEAKIEVASAKETDISLETKVSNAVYDVTKFVSVSTMTELTRFSRPDDPRVGSGFTGTFRITKISDQLIPMDVTCYATAEAEFVTVDVPPLKFLESTKLSQFNCFTEKDPAVLPAQ